MTLGVRQECCHSFAMYITVFLIMIMICDSSALSDNEPCQIRSYHNHNHKQHHNCADSPMCTGVGAHEASNSL